MPALHFVWYFAVSVLTCIERFIVDPTSPRLPYHLQFPFVQNVDIVRILHSHPIIFSPLAILRLTIDLKFNKSFLRTPNIYSWFPSADFRQALIAAWTSLLFFLNSPYTFLIASFFFSFSRLSNPAFSAPNNTDLIKKIAEGDTFYLAKTNQEVRWKLKCFSIFAAAEGKRYFLQCVLTHWSCKSLSLS